MKNDKKVLLNNFNDENDAYNDFYASVSVFLKIISFFFFAAFLLYIVYSAFVSTDAFTYDNLEYVVRNFALTLDEKQDDTVYSIKYNPDSSRSYGLLGNKFTISGNSGISVFSSTGRLTCSDSFTLKNPVMLTSDKYALVYDSGSNDLLIYNTFARVHSQTFDKPIRRACMSQKGYFAVVTSSDEYNSTVEVYNDSFKLVTRFNKSGYVIDADMFNENILITTVTQSSDYDSFNIQAQMYDVTGDKIISTAEFYASFPLACKITSSGFYLICKDEAIIYDIDSANSTVFSYNGNKVADFELTREYAALLLNRPGYDIAYRLVALDMNSEVVCDNSVDSTVYDIEICGSSICLLTEGQLHVFDRGTKKTIDLVGNTSGYKLLSCSSDALYLCTESSAPLIDINK